MTRIINNDKEAEASEAKRRQDTQTFGHSPSCVIKFLLSCCGYLVTYSPWRLIHNNLVEKEGANNHNHSI
eukprot:5574659-Pleurochrysis_carterae.AAC.2